jgi:hypothetical protein
LPLSTARRISFAKSAIKITDFDDCRMYFVKYCHRKVYNHYLVPDPGAQAKAHYKVLILGKPYD